MRVSELDPLDALLGVIRAGGWTARSELPTKLEDRLPIVQAIGLPGSATHEAWGGRTLGRIAPFDVYALAGSVEEAGDLARAVASHVEGVHGRLSIQVDSLPYEVREFNPRVKRYALKVSVSYRR